MHSIWSKDEINFLKKYYHNMGGQWCSEHLKFTGKQINGKASRLGISVSKTVRNKQQSIRATNVNRSNVNDITLTNPITHEAAYILGILWADSYVHKLKPNIRLEILYNDLIELAHIFNTTGRWCQVSRHRANRQKQLIFVTANKPLWIKLKEWDYLDRELGPVKLLEELDKSLHPSFFRGLIDGDGCFYIHIKQHLRQFSLAGSYNQNWDFFISVLDLLDIKWVIQRRIQKRDGLESTSSSTIRITNMKDIVTLGDYIYNVPNCCLQRKFDKYQQIKNHFLSNN